MSVLVSCEQGHQFSFDREIAKSIRECPQCGAELQVVEEAADGETRLPNDEHEKTVIGPPDESIEPEHEATVIGDHAEEAGDEPAQSPNRSDEQRYQLIDDFAQGGVGRIWKAHDVRIHREVAFKDLLPGAAQTPSVVERFLEEAQITGQLEHPGIFPIYDLGWCEDGTPFYSMKLVRGATLKNAIENYHVLPRESSERNLAFVKLLRNLVAICNTVAFAHERNVLHRDLKPLNIMLGDFGETLVLDWGLVKTHSAVKGESKRRRSRRAQTRTRT